MNAAQRRGTGVVLLGVFFASVGLADPGPWLGCDSPFGSLNGVGDGVPAYSNCNSSYTSNEMYSFQLVNIFPPLQCLSPDSSSTGRFAAQDPQCDWTDCPVNVTSGMTWQCVEFARRYLLVHHHAAFGSVVGATDIWLLQNVTVYSVASLPDSDCCRCTSSIVPWETWANPQPAAGGVWVRPGDLVIYPAGRVGPYGHVCVILDVITQPLSNGRAAVMKTPSAADVAATVLVGEQNWNNKPWPVEEGPSAYARTMYLVRTSEGLLELQDEPSDGLYPIVGVKRVVGTQPPTIPAPSLSSASLAVIIVASVVVVVVAVSTVIWRTRMYRVVRRYFRRGLAPLPAEPPQ